MKKKLIYRIWASLAVLTKAEACVCHRINFSHLTLNFPWHSITRLISSLSLYPSREKAEETREITTKVFFCLLRRWDLIEMSSFLSSGHGKHSKKQQQHIWNKSKSRFPAINIIGRRKEFSPNNTKLTKRALANDSIGSTRSNINISLSLPPNSRRELYFAARHGLARSRSRLFLLSHKSCRRSALFHFNFTCHSSLLRLV